MSTDADVIFADGGDVHRMVRLAVKRAIRLFDGYSDLDAASLTADMMGAVVRSWPKYDPTKSKPGTHAYRVAWCRLRDISRRRTTERKHLDNATPDLARSSVQAADRTPEEIAEEVYGYVKELMRAHGVPARLPHTRHSYPNRAQRLTLHILRERMGWSCRQAAEALRGHPSILQVLGVPQLPSPMVFSRSGNAVTQLKEFLTLSTSTSAA